MDPQARIEMREILLRLAAMGKTLIVTSHVLPELSRICDQVVIITDGRLRAAGSLDEIMKQVRQKRIMEVQVSSREQTEAIVAALRDVLGDETDIAPSEAEAIVRFETSRTDDDLGEVLSELVRRSLGVTQFREVASDLEDAFLSVTQSGETRKDAQPTC